MKGKSKDLVSVLLVYKNNDAPEHLFQQNELDLGPETLRCLCVCREGGAFG